MMFPFSFLIHTKSHNRSNHFNEKIQKKNNETQPTQTYRVYKMCLKRHIILRACSKMLISFKLQNSLLVKHFNWLFFTRLSRITHTKKSYFIIFSFFNSLCDFMRKSEKKWKNQHLNIDFQIIFRGYFVQIRCWFSFRVWLFFHIHSEIKNNNKLLIWIWL